MALSENPGGGNKRRNHLHQRPIFKCARGDIRFASALEARWASFFGALDVRWSYRPKLYLPEGVSFQYIEPLPQFWLAFVTDAQVPYNEAIPRERGLWVGVSPVPPDAETKERYRLLAQRSGHWVHLLVGEPADGFRAWSWRFSERYVHDGYHAIADLHLQELLKEEPGHGSAFDIDFIVYTVGAGACDLDLAFEALPNAVRAAIRAYEHGGMLDAALAYAACGYPIFPLDVSTKKPIPRRDPDPTGEFPDGIPGTGGVYKATCDPLIIRAWWEKYPTALIGLPMGAKSGVWCIDVDTAEDHADGVAAWNEIVAQHEAIITREHRSATGGPHLIFRWDPKQAIGCSKGDLPDGISVKGQGGYVVVPPSIRKKRAYTVDCDINPIAAPAWLIDLIKPKRAEKNWTGPEQATADANDLADAMRFVPNDGLSWDEWTAIALALFAATDGSEQGFTLFDAFSQKSAKYDPQRTRERWQEITGSPPDRTGAGKIFKLAHANGWSSVSQGRKSIKLLKHPPRIINNNNNMSLEEICARVRREIESACQLATLSWRDA